MDGNNKNVLWSSCKSSIFCVVFNKTALSRQIFIKVPNIKLHGNRPVEAVMKRADGRYVANSRFTRLSERA